MTRSIDRSARVGALIEGFPRYLDVYTRAPPFRRAGQLELHDATIRLRRELGSASAALENDRFVASLYLTLNAWGIGKRGSRLLAQEQLANALRQNAAHICRLEEASLEDDSLDIAAVANHTWDLVASLGITQNDTPIVPGTKTLHHLLPDLVVPIDRRFTQRFFLWHNPQFQYDQPGAFKFAFQAFAAVARHVEPSRYVTGGWNSSPTKVIDNAVVGFVMLEEWQAR